MGNGYINGHEYVDLGLSVKWAICNVGAFRPSDYGDYFAWGETKTKSVFSDCDVVPEGVRDISGNQIYDAARANWGGTWRLPTGHEIDELLNRCRFKSTSKDGHEGFEIIGPNGKSIFLPAAGWRSDSFNFLDFGRGRDGNYHDVGGAGNYWGGTIDDIFYGPCILDFDMDGNIRKYACFPECGLSIRPVSV